MLCLLNGAQEAFWLGSSVNVLVESMGRQMSTSGDC